MRIIFCYLAGLALMIVSCSKKSTPITPDPVVNPPVVAPPSDSNTSLVYISALGKLAYNKFANEGEINKDNVIPDFSTAGYKGGGVALPEIPVKKTISAVAGDNRLNIQNAIDEVKNLPMNGSGFRGAVLLQPGIYEVEGTLVIDKSGVVLRGMGQGLTGTIIKATRKTQHNLIELKGTGSGLAEIAGTRKKITTSYVATGVLSFDVESTVGYAVGDNIAIYRVPNQDWINALDMAQYGWTAQDYAISHERKIVAISGNTITLNAAIVDPMQIKYGGGFIYKTNVSGRINNSGIESLRVTSYYANEDDEDHGWNGIVLTRAENCWVKQVTAQYFGYSAVSLSTLSVFNTIEECAMLEPKSQTTGSRKYSFNLEAGASFNLFQRCYTNGGRHDYVSGSRVPGPNVFLDSYSINTKADIGPHHRWATGILFDNIYGGEIHVQNRKAMGSGHGWAGAQTMFWNCKSSNYDIKVESPVGAKNWGIGCTAPQKNGAGYWESWGTNVLPRSLYIAQLKDRMGAMAVNNVTTAGQRNGMIYELLRNWAGEGKLNAQ
ncbi:MAG: hypothetical protein P0Y49_19185 [Candidatus Pedobacter colombiensis]|uniref:Pectate lyase superfamily protein domain-containing protein n=1 Tax=Candidatus Pedobacter colombiensis TaxID=3121371 RepID=A0AAJ6B663_9SPHI|nr:hypothetical protein [Pedobacter sp.]WEK18900.1 MAG: hypothetical protein P0Y49_19185 [Pedobacter sp.]